MLSLHRVILKHEIKHRILLTKVSEMRLMKTYMDEMIEKCWCSRSALCENLGTVYVCNAIYITFRGNTTRISRVQKANGEMKRSP